MGYSEFQCQLCGVSFNIIFQLESGELDVPERDESRGEPDVELVVEHDNIVEDPDYVFQSENEVSEPYEYDSDCESMDTSSDHSGSLDEEITSDIQSATEERLYREWASNTFFLRARDREEPDGYYDSPTTGYSLKAISREEAAGCRTAQFMVHKSVLSGEGQPEYLRETWEETGEWYRFGICDGTPSRDMDWPTAWPAVGEPQGLEADTIDFGTNGPDTNQIAMPFHPWCFDIFCRQSKLEFGQVNVSGLMAWRATGLDWETSREFPRSLDVNFAREQWWHHEPGHEYLAANPLYIPGLPPILLNSVKSGDGLISPELRIDSEESQAIADRTEVFSTPRIDILSSLPLEVRLLIINFLDSKDIARLSMTSKTFANLPNTLWYNIVRREMPWLWEAWDKSECVHDPSFWTVLSVAEIRTAHKARVAYAEVLVRDGYMGHGEAQKAAESRFSFRSVVPEQIRLPKWETDWRYVFTAIKRNWASLKGLRNRERIWEDVGEIVRRIRALDT